MLSRRLNVTGKRERYVVRAPVTRASSVGPRPVHRVDLATVPAWPPLFSLLSPTFRELFNKDKALLTAASMVSAARFEVLSHVFYLLHGTQVTP